jgi:gliding motility-associated-like protein
MKKILYVTLLSTLLAWTLGAQPTFMKNYNINGDLTAGFMTTVSDGFLIVGEHIALSAANVNAFAMKINLNGDVLWAKHFDNIDDERFYTADEVSDGYICLGIGKYNSPAGLIESSIVYKLDVNGNEIWRRIIRFDNGTSLRGFSVVGLPDGGCIISSETRGTLYGFAMRISNNGNVVWQKVYDEGNFFTDRIIGDVIYGGGVLSGRAVTMQVSLSTGEIINTKGWDTPGFNEALYYTKSIANGNWVLSDHTWAATGGNRQSQWTTLVDSNFDRIWSKVYQIGDLNLRGQTFPANNGDGFWMIPYNGSQDTDADGYLVRLNDDGSVRWARRYGGTNYDRLWDGVELPDGGYMLVGTTNSFNPNGLPSIWVVRTDAEGRVNGVCLGDPDVIVSDYLPATASTNNSSQDLEGISVEPAGSNQPATILVESKSAQDVLLNTPTQTQLCQGQSITLNDANIPNGAMYMWSSTPSDPTLPPSGGTPTVLPSQNTTYYVTATLGTCTEKDTIDITILNATLSVGPVGPVCSGSPVTITASSDQQGAYAWSDGTTGATKDFVIDNTVTYTVTLTYGNQCTTSTTYTLGVHPSPTVSTTGTPNPAQLGQDVVLAAQISNGSGASFDWSICGSTPTTQVGTTQSVTTTIPPNHIGETITYCLIMTDANGCQYQTEVVINIDDPVVVPPKVVFPNAFTPDSDMTNDDFGPIVIGDKALLDVIQFDIYNRWGGLVFQSYPGITRWDGTSNGEPAPVDVYIYKIEYILGNGNAPETVTGEVTLLR